MAGPLLREPDPNDRISPMDNRGMGGFVNIDDAVSGSFETDEMDIVVEEDDEPTEFREDEDGSVVVSFGAQEVPDLSSIMNLAEVMSENEQMTISADLIECYLADRESRSDWATAYVRGLDLLGIKVEDRDQPFPGAAGVFHPVLLESIIRFQAQAMSELFPASGPAKSKTVGKNSVEKTKQAKRVIDEINYQTTENMYEYRDECEQMLFNLPLAGSAFKKIYYDPVEERPSSMFVPSEDLVVSFGATNLESAERFFHVMKKTPEEVLHLQAVGFWRETDLGDSSPVISDIEEKYQKLSGERQTYSGRDNRHTIIECHCVRTLPEPYNEGDDLPRPYVITMDQSSGKVLAIRRNWAKDDPRKKKRMHFVHYKYLPGLGFYGLGLIHILGGLSKTATSILRQLIDAGTFANLPAGFKTRGLRIKGDNTPLKPGEFRDIDVPGGSIKDAIHQLPFREPSATLASLLGAVVDEARRMGSVADADLSSISAQTPVGTTFAILERQMKVLSGVQARCHASLKRELRILSDIIGNDMPPRYDWDESGEFDRSSDFSAKVDVIPVSDPNAATRAQRVVQYQAALQLSAQAPNLYNAGKLHRQMLEALDIDNADEIVALPEDIKPKDPVTENMAILKQEPVRAFPYQDHESHIAVHMSAMEDPQIQKMVGQSPMAQPIMAAMQSHIVEHVALAYRKQIEDQLGVSLPPPDEPLPEDIEVELSRMVSEAAQRLLQKHVHEDKVAQAQAEAEEAQKNPLTQIQLEELDVKKRKQALEEQKAMMKHQIDIIDRQLKGFSIGANIGHQQKRLESEEVRKVADIGVKLATEPSALDKNREKMAKIAVETARLLKKPGTKTSDD